jgi:hypothetical protein
LFVNRSARDYKLRAVVTAGAQPDNILPTDMRDSYFSQDLLGVNWNNPPSRGAYEYGAATVLSGDVNSDSKVDIVDVQACVNQILGTQDWGVAADVNKDNKVDVTDVQAIVNIILGG